MPKNTTVFFTKDSRFRPTSFVTADGTAAKEVFDPSIEGSRIDNIIITSTDTVQRVLFLRVHNLNNGEICNLGHITVPAGAGTNGAVSSVAGFNRGNLPWLKIDAQGNPFLNINYRMNLEMYLDAPLSATKSISVTIFGANYDA